MRVFMLGWEFPPFISGGLGTACYGLTKGLDAVGVDVCFVLPTAIPVGTEKAEAVQHLQLRTPSDLADLNVDNKLLSKQQREDIEKFEHLEIHRLEAMLQPYASPENYQETMTAMRQHARAVAAKKVLRKAVKQSAGNAKTTGSATTPATKTPKAVPTRTTLPQGSLVLGGAGVHYDGDLMGQIHRYAALAVELAQDEEFDVIHAHDWMTFPAGMAVAAATGKPLVVHMHSTEFDRSGQNVNQQVYDIERAGMHAAAKVICVSHLTSNICQHRYGLDANKIAVVYNAVDLNGNASSLEMEPIDRDEKIVLFLGRITMQKGPEYFLQAAKKVVEKYQKVRFVVAGSGDMIRHCIRLVADLAIGRYVTFTGFLRGDDVNKIFEMADLYVMPSVSEPFGIAPLEAISHDVPVIISKQSGVSEVLTHVLKVDFWDTEDMANKILAVLRHEPLQKTLRQHGLFELSKLSWEDSAENLKEIYANLIPKV